MDLEQLNKIVRAIGSFILTCILFACPICLALLIYTKHLPLLGLVLLLISIAEFFFVLFSIYFHSEED